MFSLFGLTSDNRRNPKIMPAWFVRLLSVICSLQRKWKQPAISYFLGDCLCHGALSSINEMSLKPRLEFQEFLTQDSGTRFVASPDAAPPDNDERRSFSGNAPCSIPASSSSKTDMTGKRKTSQYRNKSKVNVLYEMRNDF